MIGEFSRYFILDTSIGHLRILWSAIKTPTATQVIIKEAFFIFWAQNQQSCSEVLSYLISLRLLLFSITTQNYVIGTSFAKKRPTSADRRHFLNEKLTHIKCDSLVLNH